MDVTCGLVVATNGLIPVSAEHLTVSIDNPPILYSGASCLVLTIPEVGCLTLLYRVSFSAEADWACGERVCLTSQTVLLKSGFRGLVSWGPGPG